MEMKSVAPIGAMQWIPISKLKIHWGGGQRETNATRAHRIADEFDPDLLGALVVCRVSDAVYHIIDGGHRREGAWLKFKDPTQKMPCIVVDNCGEGRASKLFAELNGRNRVAVNSIDRFSALVNAKEQPESYINSIVIQNGFLVKKSPGPNHIRAVNALISIHRRHGPAVLDRTLRLIGITWKGDSTAIDREFLLGVSALVATHNAILDDKSFVKAVEKTVTPSGLLARAKAGARDMFGGDTSRAIERYLVLAYNARLTNGRLPIEGEQS